MLDYEQQEQAEAVQIDSNRIKNDLENIALESDQCPIKVAGIDLCQIAERMSMQLSVETLVSKHTKQENDAIFEKLEQFEMTFLDEPHATKKKRTKKRKLNLIFQYVKANCSCVAYY